MEIKNRKYTGSFQDYISMSESLIGYDDTLLYLEKNKKLFNHPRFYKKWCKVYFMGRSLEDVVKNFKKDTIWATFHPDWITNFGKIVIRKNTKDIYITTDTKLALQFLNDNL